MLTWKISWDCVKTQQFFSNKMNYWTITVSLTLTFEGRRSLKLLSLGTFIFSFMACFHPFLWDGFLIKPSHSRSEKRNIDRLWRLQRHHTKRRIYCATPYLKREVIKQEMCILQKSVLWWKCITVWDHTIFLMKNSWSKALLKHYVLWQSSTAINCKVRSLSSTCQCPWASHP